MAAEREKAGKCHKTKYTKHPVIFLGQFDYPPRSETPRKQPERSAESVLRVVRSEALDPSL